MYACATNAFERKSIDDLIYGSVTDVLDRFIPDKEKHGALRGMLSFLAINTVYRGPATPGTAASLAYGFAMPSADAQLVSKIRGGIGVLSEHLVEQFEAAGGALRLTAEVAQILAEDGQIGRAHV